MSRHISNIYLNLFLSHLRRQNVDQRSLFDELGLGEYYAQGADRDGSIDALRFIDLLHQAEERFANRLFSAQAGSFIHPTEYGLLGYLIMACKNYGQVIEIAYRHQYLVNTCFCREPLREGNQILSRIQDDDMDPEYMRPYAELEFATLVHMSHFLTGHMFSEVPITLAFKHKPATSISNYMEVFRTELSFETAHNEIRMHEIVLDAPIYGHNEDTLRLMLGEVRNRQSQKKNTFLDEVTAYIQVNIIHGKTNLNECAEKFGMSGSTLKRRLSKEGTSYQELTDNVRHSVACNLLNNSSMNMSDISCVLGFSTVSAFSRAFRGWAGVTPKQYKKALLSTDV